MTLRDQMDDAYMAFGVATHMDRPNEHAAFQAGFRAALNLIANPDDEMVERCASEVAKVLILRGSCPDAARACLKAIGDTK